MQLSQMVINPDLAHFPYDLLLVSAGFRFISRQNPIAGTFALKVDRLRERRSVWLGFRGGGNTWPKIDMFNASEGKRGMKGWKSQKKTRWYPPAHIVLDVLIEIVAKKPSIKLFADE